MIIAHDLGTSGDKASLHDMSGRLLASTSVSYPTHYAGTAAEQDPRQWWRATVQATRELLATTGTSADRITGLCISGQMMGLVLLDAAGEPVRPAMIWSDQRAEAQSARLTDAVGAEHVYAVTGHRMGPTYPLPKLLWVRDNEPERYARTAAVCVAKDYVNYRLTGWLVTDHSDASSTDAYDLMAGTWSSELLAAAEVDAALWPPILDSTDIVGTLTTAAAEELGLPPHVRVVTGGGDGLMAGVGAGCVDPRSPGYVCLGTSAWYSCTTTAPVLDAQQRSFTYRHVVPGRFAPCATTQTGAGSLQWAAAAIGDGSNELSDFIEAAMKVPAADEGLFFLPYLIGERTPWWDPHASAVFVGMRMQHRRENLARAVLEGVGYALALCQQPLRPTGMDAPIDVIGGGAVSDAWLALLADIWGAPVRRRSVTTQANSLGAAVTGLVGLGEAEFGIATTLSRIEAEFVPGERSAAQTAHLRRYADAYLSLRDWFAASTGGS